MREICFILMTLLGLAGAAAAADDVTASIENPVVYTDEVARVTVEIAGSADGVAGITLDAPEGFRVEGPLGGTRKMSIVNGVRKTSVEVGFRVSPPADASGSYTLGPLRITRESGKTEAIPVGTLTVGARPKSSVRMTVEAVPPSGPVGMPFVARYRILYSGRPYLDEDAFGNPRHPFGLTALSLPVLTATDVRAEAVGDGSGESLRIGDDTSVSITRGSAETEDGVFQTLELRVKVTPLSTADVDLTAEAGLALVDRTEKRRTFFGEVVEVPVGKEFRARTPKAVYHVEELPAKGRPALFTGAVGRYTIAARAEPTEVNAFDPVTVTVTVRGEGVLDRVVLPKYGDDPEIAKEFEVDSDVDPGKIEGDAKVFRVVFRPRSSAVAAIPPLPLPHYDPWAGAYRTAESEAIPLVVHDVRTIRADEAVGGPSAGPVAEGGAPADPLVARSGIAANYETLDEGVDRLRARPPLLTPGFLLLLALPPLFFGAALIVSILRRRPKDVPKGTPLSAALAALAGTSDPDRASGAVADYFRRRLELPAGEVTPKEVRRALAARVVPEETVERAVRAVEGLERARFAGESGIPAEVSEMLREVDRCLG